MSSRRRSLLDELRGFKQKKIDKRRSKKRKKNKSSSSRKQRSIIEGGFF